MILNNLTRSLIGFEKDWSAVLFYIVGSFPNALLILF